jgi:nucleoside-diphosphate-sugar epimerase
MSDAETLILGATSLVGRFLAPRLASAGRAPLALSRHAAPKGVGVIWVKGALEDPDLADRLPRLGVVFSLSPIWLLPDALPMLIKKGARRVIAFSSTSRFTKIKSPVEAERQVAARLAESEARAIALCESAGVGWTILRPTLIYAEGQDGNVSRLADLIRRFGVLPLAGQGEGLRQPVHGDDLAKAALAAAQSSAAVNQAYDLPGGETLTYRLMVERVFEGLGRRPRILAVPAPVWAAAFRLASPLLPGATAAMGSRMAENLVFDAGPAHRDLAWSPRAFHPDFKASSPPGTSLRSWRQQARFPKGQESETDGPQES